MLRIRPVGWRAAWLTALAVFALSGVVLAAQTGGASGGISGIVVAGNGLPVAGATVHAGAAQAVSDPEGRFVLNAAANTITVTAKGFAPATVNVTTSPLRVELVPAAMSESVTVTATARNQTTAAVPLETRDLGSARLQNAVPDNVDTILRSYSDLGTFRVNSSLTANPTTQGVALLGTGSSGASRALVLLDGIPLNDFFGGWVDWLRAPVEGLSNISVVSGGASPLYGTEALSGVIGMQTQPAVKTALDLRAGGGGLGTGLADGDGAIVDGKWSVAGSGRVVHVGGYIPASPAGTVDDDAGVTAQDWAPTVRYIASPNAMFSLSSEYFGENRQNGTVLTVNETRLRQIAGRAIIEHDGVWNGNFFDQSEDYSQTFSSVASDRDSETLVNEQQTPSRAQGAALDWTLARPIWSLIAGASYTHITASDNETNPRASLLYPSTEENGRQRLAGAFMEGTLTPLTQLSFTATLRKDRWSNYDAFQNALVTGGTPPAYTLTPYPDRFESAWSPSVGAIYTASPWLAFHLSGYQSFRAPTLNELYRPYRVGEVETLANAGLTAERYRGAQIGTDITPSANTRFEATYFDGFISNLVTSVTLSTTPSLITEQRQNVGLVRARGLTLSNEWTLRPGLTLWNSYTHVYSRTVSAAQASLVGLLTPHVPQNNYSGTLLYAVRGWSLSGVERFGGSNYDDAPNMYLLPSFWNTDLSVSRAFGNYAPYVAVENLWNRRYAIELNTTELNSPRAVTVGIRIHLGRAQ